MAEVKLNENGEFVNVETGQVLGNIQRGLSFNSAGAELKTLQDMGVQLPDLPDEEQELNDDDSTTEEKNIQLSSKDVLKQDNSSIINKSIQYKDSKYHVNKDSFFIIKFGLLQQSQDGRFIPITYQATDDFAQSEKHWVKFRMWYYNEELQWKQNVMEYNNKVKAQILNQDKLNEIKLKKLMLDWSFSEFDDKLKLLHCNGILSDESYNMFMGLHPSIAKTIVDLMNLVLENNQ